MVFKMSSVEFKKKKELFFSLCNAITPDLSILCFDLLSYHADLKLAVKHVPIAHFKSLNDQTSCSRDAKLQHVAHFPGKSHVS